MAIPKIGELEEAAKKVVHASMRAGTISSLTPRMVRQELEKKFSLDAGSLDGAEYKVSLRAAIARAVEENPFVDETSEDSPKGARNRLKKKRTSNEGPAAELQLKSKPSAPKAKKVKEKTKPTSKSDIKPTSKRKSRKKDTKEFKSTEHVPTSDVEIEESKSNKDDNEEQEVKEESSSTPPRKRRKVVVSDEEFDEEEEMPKPLSKGKSPSKAKPKDEDNIMKSESEVEVSDASIEPKGKGKENTKAPEEEEDAAKSDSELSILIDEPPKRKGKGKAKEATKTTRKTSTKGSANLSKDEETIKRLKSFVVACGVRKVWSKVFQDIDSPQQQIKKLKEILADLGMTGRMSIEKAKAIREKRELAMELEEVQQFEKSVVGASHRNAKASEKAKKSSSDSDKVSESGEEEVIPRKRARNARQSIMAFLQDQSDDSG